MRYEKGHKEATRQRIIETASKQFRKDGVEATGLAGLMSNAGLTHGGFYSHFASKEDLVREAVASALAETHGRMAQVAASNEGGLEALLRFYLTTRHRDHPERGCAAAALAPELGRHPKATREAFMKSLDKIIDLFAGKLPDKASPEARRSTAIAIFACMMGTIQLSRTVTDPELSEQVIENGVSAALTLARALEA